MANYATLKAAIQDVIKTNGNEEITGALLQQSLLAMINSLGAGYQFAGVATQSTNPGTPDQNVFYVGAPGTYAHFGTSRTVPAGYLGFFKWNGSWAFDTVQVGDADAVKYVAQTLTDAQKLQARTNIAAADAASILQLAAVIANKVPVASPNLIDPSEVVLASLLRPNGNVAAQPEQRYMYYKKYIPVNGSNIYASSVINNSTWPAFVVYDANLNVRRAVHQTNLYTYQEGDAYVRINFAPVSITNWITRIMTVYGSTAADYIPYNPIYQYLDSLGVFQLETRVVAAEVGIQELNNDKVDVNVKTENILDLSTVTDGKILRDNNLERAAAGYGYSDYILVDGKSIVFYFLLADGTNTSACIYDENKTFLRSEKYTAINYVSQYTFQEGDYYIRVNLKNQWAYNTPPPYAKYGTVIGDYVPYDGSPIGGYLTKVNLELAGLDARLSALENVENPWSPDQYKALFGNIICIGDSITAGNADNAGTPKALSYPSFMAKMGGWNIENTATGGQTPRGWWANKFSLYDYTDYNVAIIYLGQNGGLTDTLDTDVDPYNDYNDYADTNTGCYCKIIEGIWAQNPNIKIFMLKGTSNSSWESIERGVTLDKISAKYSIPMFNIKNNPWVDLNQDKYHPHFVNGSRDYIHYGTIGYLALGRVIYSYLLKYILEHESVFETLLENVS